MNIKNYGFTLIELVVAMSIGLVIIAAVYASVNVAQRSSASVGRKVTTQQDVRAVLNIMAMEIRMASLNPSASRTIWTTIPVCSSMGNVTAVKENKGIQVAGPNIILIAMDLNDPPLNPSISSIGDLTNEYIEYELHDDRNTISRNVSCGGDNDILGKDDSTNVRNGSETGTPLFQYFDKNDTQLTVPVSIPDIRRVRITIVVDTKDPDSLTGGVKRTTYTTDVLVKNHVLCP